MRSQVQVGGNACERVVKMRAPDEKSDGGYIVQRLTPSAARVLADWLGDGVPGKVLKISDGRRWSEHELSPEVASKIADDLMSCAAAVEAGD